MINPAKDEYLSLPVESPPPSLSKQPLKDALETLRRLLSDQESYAHYNTRQSITLLLVGEFDDWIDQNSISIDKVHKAADLEETKFYLNSNNIDVCILKPHNNKVSAKAVLNYINKYNIACGSIVLYECTDPIIEDAYLEMGATDIFPIEEFDSIIGPRIIQLSYFHAITNYQHRMKLEELVTTILTITEELKMPILAIQGCLKLLRHLNINANIYERRVFNQLFDNIEYLKEISGTIDDAHSFSAKN